MFRWEDELRRSFLATAIPSLWTSAASFDAEHVLEERSWSDGRADAVWAGVIGQIRPCEKIGLLRDPVASRIVADLCPRAPRTEPRLLAASGVTRATFRSTLSRLVAERFVQPTETGSFVLGIAFPAWSAEFCAFEFKLRDWRRAFYQALRYRAFAHRVYIVLPKSTTGGALDQAERFRTFGIGLIEHDPEGTSRALIRARKAQPRSRASYMRAMADLATSMA